MPSVGPLATTMNDLKIATESILKSFMIDSSLPPLPFNNQAYQEIVSRKKKLRVGYFDEMPLMPSSASIKRAIKIAKEKLEAQGYNLVPFKISEEENLTLKRVHTSACTLGIFGQFNDMFKRTHEHPISVYGLMFFFYNLPKVLQFVVKNLVRILASKRLALGMDCLKEYRSQEIDQVLIDKIKFEIHMAKRIE
jgi:hypothetical protein